MAAESSRSASTIELALVGLAVAVLYVLALAGLGSPHRGPEVAGIEASPEALIGDDDFASAARLDQAFDRLGYRLDRVRAGAEPVPALFLPAVPADLAELPDIDTKKAVFLRVMLPLVLLVNEEVLDDRRRLLAMAERAVKGRAPSAVDEAWLAELAERYDVSGPNPLGRLLRRVDAVPVSLALAQAAEESGWGTSRQVRKGNNLFGHSAAAEENQAPRLRSFGSLHEAVRAYVHNLNTHRAYEQLRRTRASARDRNLFADGHTLAAALASYSERGQAYVSTIRSLIRANGLLRFDHAELNHTRPERKNPITTAMAD